MTRCVLITGSSGLIGSEAVAYYARQGCEVHGIDNNMRAQFFGPGGDTTPNLTRLLRECPNFTHHNEDIRTSVLLFQRHPFDLIIHCAAQPSHDWAARAPEADFSVNATGTLVLLEAVRKHCPDATFVFMSTNKVYGDNPNRLPLVELSTRWAIDPTDPYFQHGIDETMSVDQTKHSLFGASKLAADVLVQEYGRYFGMNTVCFRGGCLTGPQHAGVKLHGFLSYLIACAVEDRCYTIIGYGGKQVRDQIHSADVVSAIDAFAQNPRPGEVYNIGGGYLNSASILECIAKLQDKLGRPVRYSLTPDARIGDHICYYSDMRKFQRHYPQWHVTKTLDQIIDEMIEAGAHNERT